MLACLRPRDHAWMTHRDRLHGLSLFIALPEHRQSHVCARVAFTAEQNYSHPMCKVCGLGHPWCDAGTASLPIATRLGDCHHRERQTFLCVFGYGYGGVFPGWCPGGLILYQKASDQLRVMSGDSVDSPDSAQQEAGER